MKRHFNIPTRLLYVYLGVAAALPLTDSLQAQTYTAQLINPPPGTVSCTADALNNAGTVAGRTMVSVGSGRKATTARGPAFIWANGVSTVLPPLAGRSEAEGYGVSDDGLAVGGGPGSSTIIEEDRAVWWESTPGGYEAHDWNEIVPAAWNLTLLRAVSISADGQYVGFSANLGGSVFRDIVVHVQLDGTGTKPLELGEYWDVVGIWGLSSVRHDGAGLVVATGLGGPDVPEPGAWLWIKDGANPPVLLDRHPVAEYLTSGWDANIHGEIAGFRRNSGIERAAVWTSAGEMMDIGTLGGTSSHAKSINDAGLVVGWSSNGLKGKNGGLRAFLWDGISMVDLNTRTTSGSTLTQGRRINNAGQILCWGSNGSVLLTPQ